jgi:hypothetical protein
MVEDIRKEFDKFRSTIEDIPQEEGSRSAITIDGSVGSWYPHTRT